MTPEQHAALARVITNALASPRGGDSNLEPALLIYATDRIALAISDAGNVIYDGLHEIAEAIAGGGALSLMQAVDLQTLALRDLGYLLAERLGDS